MDWLITGGCGFIGTCLVKDLIADSEEHNIRVVDNLSVGTREDLGAVCEFEERSLVSFSSSSAQAQLFPGDIQDDQLALELAQDVDVIVHLAANTGVVPSVEDPRSDCMANVLGTLNYLEAARINKVRRFIFASSGAPVGEVEPPIHEDLAPHPASPYGASKLAGEGYCSAFYRTFGVETVSLRFGNVYSMQTARRSKQYMNIDDLEPLFKLPGIIWINLQYDECAKELKEAQEKFDITIHNWPDLNMKDDLDQTAAMSSLLDMAIGANAAPLAMASCLGIPVLAWGANSTMAQYRKPVRNYKHYPALILDRYYKQSKQDFVRQTAEYIEQNLLNS